MVRLLHGGRYSDSMCMMYPVCTTYVFNVCPIMSSKFLEALHRPKMAQGREPHGPNTHSQNNHPLPPHTHLNPPPTRIPGEGSDADFAPKKKEPPNNTNRNVQVFSLI